MVCVLVITPHLRLLFTRVLISTPRVLLPTTIHVPTCSFSPTTVPKYSSPSFFCLPCCCILLMYFATPLLGFASGSYLSGPSNHLTAWSALPASPQKSSTRSLLLHSCLSSRCGTGCVARKLASRASFLLWRHSTHAAPSKYMEGTTGMVTAPCSGRGRGRGGGGGFTVGACEQAGGA